MSLARETRSRLIHAESRSRNRPRLSSGCEINAETSRWTGTRSMYRLVDCRVSRDPLAPGKEETPLLK